MLPACIKKYIGQLSPIKRAGYKRKGISSSLTTNKPTNNMKVIIALALVAVVAADHPRPAPYHPAPAPYHPAPAYKPAPSYHQPQYPDVAPAYNYEYAVKDDYANVDFNANENRNDYATSGSYSVLLPDGRTQTVTYKVDDAYSGFVADVSYAGEARYDAPAPYHPAPAYKPAPTYHPAPAYKPAPRYPAPHA